MPNNSNKNSAATVPTDPVATAPTPPPKPPKPTQKNKTAPVATAPTPTNSATKNNNNDNDSNKKQKHPTHNMVDLLNKANVDSFKAVKSTVAKTNTAKIVHAGLHDAYKKVGNAADFASQTTMTVAANTAKTAASGAKNLAKQVLEQSKMKGAPSQPIDNTVKAPKL